jgi:23S rRNA pseudouridine2605 synthase
VNGRVVTELGTKVSAEDLVCLDGSRLGLEEKLRYIILNKPAGYLSSMEDPEGRKLAADLLADIPERVYNVGRLDLWSSGILIFTNDGELARALSHPSSGVEKEYELSTDSPIPTDFLIAFRKGVEIEGVVYKAKVARRTGEKSARIVLVEGKNREIRRVAEHFGLRTLGLCRVRIGKLELAGLPVGFHRDLSPEEVAGLKALVPRPKD